MEKINMKVYKHVHEKIKKFSERYDKTETRVLEDALILLFSIEEQKDLLRNNNEHGELEFDLFLRTSKRDLELTEIKRKPLSEFI
jgi:hypothetical protein